MKRTPQTINANNLIMVEKMANILLYLDKYLGHKHQGSRFSLKTKFFLTLDGNAVVTAEF